MFSFTEPDLPDVVYLEQLTSALYLDKREDIAPYAALLKELQHDNPTTYTTRDLLRSLLSTA